MNKITFPLKPRMKGPAVDDLEDGLQLLLDRGVMLANDEAARRELSAALQREHTEQTFGEATRKLVSIFQQERHLEVSGMVDEPTASALNRVLAEMDGSKVKQTSNVVKGTVRLFDGTPAEVRVSAFDRDLRREQTLGKARPTDRAFSRFRTPQVNSARRRKAMPISLSRHLP